MFKDFLHYILNRSSYSQFKAKKLYDKLKFNNKNFEIEWNHYLLGELTTEQFGI